MEFKINNNTNNNTNIDKLVIPKELGTIAENYILFERIGSGSFGEVYIAQYKKGGYVAAKVENKKKCPRIYNEYKIYKYLHNKNFKMGLPKIYGFYQTPLFNIMIMQLLGPNLEDLFNKYNRKFKLETVLLLADQLIYLLDQLHKSDFIHRDIKPNNFLIGRGTNSSQVYIMDFGLSKKYIMEDGSHMPFKNGRSLIGTARYASINMHMGMEPSRRDDLESVGYMLMYFLKGTLPWQGIKKQKDTNHIELIGEMKMCTNLDTLCDGVPDCFKEYINYTRNLKFEQDPDYNWLRKLFTDTANKLNIKMQYEWSMN